MRIYGDLAQDWYPLLDPIADHEDEGELYAQVFGDATTLLELGSGAGNAAFFLKQRYETTLSDLSEAMLELSQSVNPECEHVQGDMRTLRLARAFDAVLVHDALSYLTTRSDLRAAIETVFIHLSDEGVAIFAPDDFRETFQESTHLHQGEIGDRSLRCIEWFWDPDSSDDTCVADYVFALREGEELQTIHDRHVIGVFPRELWVHCFTDVGFDVSTVPRPIEPGPYADEIFVVRKRD